MFAVKNKILKSDHRNKKKYLLTIATILLLPFHKCLRLKIIFQDRRGGKCFVARTLNQNGKKTKKQKLKEQWFLEEEAKNHCELIAALM